MAIGDDAIAAGIPIIDSATTDADTIGDEINTTRDILAVRAPSVIPIAKGGTGSTTASGARSALGVQTTVTAVSQATASVVENRLVKGGAGGRLNVGAPTASGHAATKGYVDAILATASPTAAEGVLLVGGTGGRVNVGTPITGGNAANKSYVDSVQGELDALRSEWLPASFLIAHWQTLIPLLEGRIADLEDHLNSLDGGSP